MAYFMKTRVTHWLTALALWAALALGLGYHHSLVAPGMGGWPLPSPEAAGGWLLYVFGPTPRRGALTMAWWLTAVPLGGVLWVTLQYLLGPFFGSERAKFSDTLKRYA